MKVKQNDIKMLLLALGVMAALCSHFLVHEPLTEQMVALQSEIDAALTEKTRLTEVEANMPVLLSEIEANTIIVENEFQKYPEDVLTETFIMYADNLRNQLDITILDVTITAPTMITKAEIMRKVEETDVVTPIASYITTLSFQWELSYSQLKSFIEYVHAERERTVLHSITIAYDASTGKLTGASVINKYFIATPNYLYVPPDIPLGPTGTDDPFGTVTS